MDRHLAFILASREIVTMEDLAEQGVDDLMDIEIMTEERAGELIMTARAPGLPRKRKAPEESGATNRSRVSGEDMAQVTVQQARRSVGASVDRLLTQMKEAGLPHTEAEKCLDEDKQTLLTFLKRSHGETTDGAQAHYAQAKTLSTLEQCGVPG